MNKLLILSASIMLLFSCGKGKTAEVSSEKTVSVKTEKSTIYTIDASKSTAKWWGYKLFKSEASSHNGNIPIKEGELYFDNGELSGGYFVANVAGLSNSDEKGDSKTDLENHLKSGDFFEVEKYPTAKFEITSVEKNGKKYNVSGNLTMKDKTNNITFSADAQIMKEKVVFITEKFDINRQNWGINYKAEYKDVLIKDEVSFEVLTEAILKK